MWRSDASGNVSGYRERALDAEFDRATHAATPQAAARAWHAALVILARDVPAMVLNAPDNVAAIHRRITGVRLRPDSYWALVRTWRIPPEQQIDRDRAGR